MKEIRYYFVAVFGTLTLSVILWLVCAFLYKVGFDIFPAYGDDTNWIIGGALVATIFLLYWFRYTIFMDTLAPTNGYPKAFYDSFKTVANILLIALIVFIMCC